MKNILTLAALCIFLASCSDMQLKIPGVARPLFRDEFVLGQTGTWQLESDETGSTSIVPEQLILEIKSPNLVQYTTLKEPVLDDFSLTVDGRIISGSPQSSYGVLFRKQGPQQFYRFEITGDGTYILERHNEDGSRALFMGDWRKSDAINPGLNAVNRFGVEAVGSTISISINDNLLEQIKDDAYASGNIALDAGTFEMVPVQVAFDNLVIYPPGGN